MTSFPTHDDIARMKELDNSCCGMELPSRFGKGAKSATKSKPSPLAPSGPPAPHGDPIVHGIHPLILLCVVRAALYESIVEAECRLSAMHRVIRSVDGVLRGDGSPSFHPIS